MQNHNQIYQPTPSVDGELCAKRESVLSRHQAPKVRLFED